MIVLTNRLNKILSSRLPSYKRNYTDNEILNIIIALRDVDVMFKTSSINNEIVINLDNLSLLTYATPRSPNLEILSQIRDADVEYFLIGDAKSPGSVVNATGSGNQIGLDI